MPPEQSPAKNVGVRRDQTREAGQLSTNRTDISFAVQQMSRRVPIDADRYEECPLCTQYVEDDPTSDSNVRCRRCGYFACEPCVRQIMETTGRYDCPHCRLFTEITENERPYLLQFAVSLNCRLFVAEQTGNSVPTRLWFLVAGCMDAIVNPGRHPSATAQNIQGSLLRTDAELATSGF
jgi:DNA-directed RNA polymerase subunit RPC12/RpoP